MTRKRASTLKVDSTTSEGVVQVTGSLGFPLAPPPPFQFMDARYITAPRAVTQLHLLPAAVSAKEPWGGWRMGEFAAELRVVIAAV